MHVAHEPASFLACSAGACWLTNTVNFPKGCVADLPLACLTPPHATCLTLPAAINLKQGLLTKALHLECVCPFCGVREQDIHKC